MAKLIKMKMYYIEYWDLRGTSSLYNMLIEADSYSEAEKLFIENFSSRKIKSIAEYGVSVYRKSIKTVNIEV